MTLLAGCATLPPEIPESSGCRANFLGLDQRVDAAGVHNGGAYAIAGFPYLRSDRFLASFRREVSDGAAFEAWVERLRQLDLQSRESELRNLGWPDPAEELAHLDRCGKAWAARDLASTERRTQLRENAKVPDDYSLLERMIGLYPLVVPVLNLGISGFDKDVAADYARPAGALDAPGPLVLWRAEPGKDAADPFAKLTMDALGIPEFTAAQWRALAQAHMPAWLVETGGEFDRIGAPVRKAGEPTVDATSPRMYFLPAYTRFGGKVLPQLVYVVWFSERPRQKTVDFYGGALDGIVWRVTLDTEGRPLLYDTIHACGCYHYYFPAQALKRKDQGGFWDEPVLMPQQAPPEPFAIRVQSGTHYVRRLVPLKDAGAGETRSLSLADYGELLSLPDSPGHPRSLFGEDGLVQGSDRLERSWLWPAGIKSAGAMRQWGRHATSFVGRSHFDDAGLLERLFEP